MSVSLFGHGHSSHRTSSQTACRSRIKRILAERGLFGLVSASDTSREERDQEVERTAVVGMLNLADILEMIDVWPLRFIK